MKETWITSQGALLWLSDEGLHREDGPSVVWEDGSQHWHQGGKLHCSHGPAVRWAFGVEHWFLEGERLTEEEWQERTGR